MGIEENRQLRWIFAIGLSLALHVSVVVLMVGIGGDDLAPSPVAVPSKPEKAEPQAPKPMFTPPAPTPVAPSAPTAAIPSGLAQGEAPACKTYIVKSGDNLSKIAKLDGSTLAELAELNGTDVKTLSRLQPGQKIKVRNGVE